VVVLLEDLNTNVTVGTTSAEEDLDVDQDVSVQEINEEDESDSSSESSDTSVEGIEGSYYGGYGRCFNCGKRISKDLFGAIQPFVIVLI